MKCPKYERWISDAIDGNLSEKKKKILRGHLATCPGCRAYHDRLVRIQVEAVRPAEIPLPPCYWEDFSVRLDKKLRALEAEGKPASLSRRGWRWAGAAAALFLAAALSLVFLRNQGQPPEDKVISFEVCLNRLSEEIGEDTELEEHFNSLIVDSLGELSGLTGLEECWVVFDEPSFWEGLSDEDLEFVEEEIKKEIKS